MMLKTVLIMLYIFNVHCQRFGVKWRLEKLEEKYFKEMTELKEGLGIVVEMINNKTCACGASNGSEYGKVRELKSDKATDKLYEDITRHASETFSGIKRAFVEEKESIRKTVAEIRHEYQGTVSVLRDEVDKLRNEIYDDINEQLKALQNVQLITDSNTRQINQLSNSAANIAYDISMTRSTLRVNQDSILQLKNTVRELRSKIQINSGLLSLSKQNMNWRCYAGSCYFIGKSATWKESKQKCTEFGAKLAEVESEEENQFLINFAAEQTKGLSDYGVFLGASDLDEEGTWKWVASNRNVDETYNNFKGSEPNGRTRENCLHLYRYGGWMWNDTLCGERMGFICEFSEHEI